MQLGVEDAQQRGLACGITVEGPDHDSTEVQFLKEVYLGLERGVAVVENGFASLVGVGGVGKFGENFVIGVAGFMKGGTESIAVKGHPKIQSGGGNVAPDPVFHTLLGKGERGVLAGLIRVPGAAGIVGHDIDEMKSAERFGGDFIASISVAESGGQEQFMRLEGGGEFGDEGSVVGSDGGAFEVHVEAIEAMFNEEGAKFRDEAAAVLGVEQGGVALKERRFTGGRSAADGEEDFYLVPFCGFNDQGVGGIEGKVSGVADGVFKREVEVRELFEIDFWNECREIDPVGNVGDNPGRVCCVGCASKSEHQQKERFHGIGKRLMSVA